MVDGGGNPVMRRAPGIGVTVWAAVVAVGMLWPLVSPLPDGTGVDAAPFYGRWRSADEWGLDVVGRLLPAVALGAMIVWAWPRFAARASIVTLAVAAGVASSVWAVALAGAGGVSAIWSPLASRYGYLGIGLDGDVSTFVRTYVDRLGSYPTHVKGHPPGMPLVLRAIDAVGLSGAEGAAVLGFVVWGAGITAVVLTVRELGGDTVARRASGVVAFLPAAVFVGTTFDAFFAGATSLAIATLVFAARRVGWRADAAAVVGGMLAAGCLYLSYGLAPLALVPAVILWRERRVRPWVLAALGAILVVVAFAAAGFWWLDGLNATRGFYEEGLARLRPYPYFVFAGNPAALALSLGPAVAAGFGTALGTVFAAGTATSPAGLWRRIVAAGWPLMVLAAVAAVAAADLSGLSKAEVERIWLPFMPWLAVAGTAVWTRRSERGWLLTSVVLAIGLQAALVTPW